MATFLQQKPREFSKYTPDIDNETYAKLLAAKDEKYQEGIQKINSIQTSMASLPIGQSAALNYYNEKLKKFNSELNNVSTADFSDQNFVNSIASYAGTIAQDRTIQDAVVSTQYARKTNSDTDADTENVGGANIANKTLAMEEIAKWQNSSDPNAKYRGNYTPWQDKRKWTTDLLANKKPNWIQIDTPATDRIDPITGKVTPAYKQWSLITNSWKEVPAKDIQDILELGIRNDPNIANQFAIDAQYSLKDYNKENYLYKLQGENKNIQSINNGAIDNLTKMKLGIVDASFPPDVQQMTPEQQKSWIDTQIDTLKVANDALTDYDYEKELTLFDNPVYQKQFKENLYKQSWIQEQIAVFGGKTEQKVTYQGDPFDKAMSYQRMQRDIENDRIKNLNTIWDQKHTIERDKNADAQWEKENPGVMNPVPLPAPTESNVIAQPWTNVLRSIDNETNQYNNAQNRFLYNVLPSDLKDELFTLTYDEKRNPVILQKEGIEVANKVKDIMDLFQKVNKVGNDITVQYGSLKIPLSNATIKNLNSLNLSYNSLKTLTTLKNKADEEFNKTDAGKLIGKEVSEINNHLVEYNTKYNTHIKPTEINNFFEDLAGNKDLYKDLNFITYDNSEGQYVSTKLTNELIAKYGKDKFIKYSYISTMPSVQKLVDDRSELVNKRSEYYNIYAHNNQLIPDKNNYQLTTGNEKHDDLIRSRVLAIISIESPEELGSDVLKKVYPSEIKNNLKNSNIYYYQDPVTKDSYIGFSNASEKNAPHYVKIKDASSLQGLVPNVPQPYTSATTRILLANKGTYKNPTMPTWDESWIIKSNPDGTQIRQGLTFDGNTWSSHIFTGHNKNDAIQKPDVPIGNNIEEIAKYIDNQMINNGTLIREGYGK